jgi:hypothetical protein
VRHRKPCKQGIFVVPRCSDWRFRRLTGAGTVV